MQKSSNQLTIQQSQLKDATISITGYRHASNLLIAASILLPNSLIKLTNIPNLLDTEIMIEILNELGAKCYYQSNMLTINTSSISNHIVSKHLSKQIHGSVYLIPAILGRFGKVVFTESGGCQIGSKTDKFKRPINHILDVIEAFGAKIDQSDNEIVAEAKLLKPAEIDISKFSSSESCIEGPLTSGATKTAIFLALAAKQGKTTILNPFLKSEVIDLLNFLSTAGYKIHYNDSKIEIEHSTPHEDINHHVISDPSEIITYITMGVFHNINLILDKITYKHTIPILNPELSLLKSMGINYTLLDDKIIIHSNNDIQAVDISITPKGVCTDHHPLLVAILLKANQSSKLTEHVWHDRFNYISEINKFGANLKQNHNTVHITPCKLTAASEHVICHDLRAAALLVILSLGTPGTTILINTHHLYRGYQRFIENITSMGGRITR